MTFEYREFFCYFFGMILLPFQTKVTPFLSLLEYFPSLEENYTDVVVKLEPLGIHVVRYSYYVLKMNILRVSPFCAYLYYVTSILKYT